MWPLFSFDSFPFSPRVYNISLLSNIVLFSPHYRAKLTLRALLITLYSLLHLDQGQESTNYYAWFKDFGLKTRNRSEKFNVVNLHQSKNMSITPKLYFSFIYLCSAQFLINQLYFQPITQTIIHKGTHFKEKKTGLTIKCFMNVAWFYQSNAKEF